MKREVKILISLLVALIVATAAYLLTKNYSIRITKNPVPLVSTTTKPSTTDTLVTKHYINKQYGFSFDYSEDTNQDLGGISVDETSQGVTFSAGGGGPWFVDVTIESTTFTDPVEKVTQMNKELGKLNPVLVQNVIERNIVIDGYPAVVTYQKNTSNGEIDKDRRVFFVKDKLLFTISTRQEDDALWNSFKFTK